MFDFAVVIFGVIPLAVRRDGLLIFLAALQLLRTQAVNALCDRIAYITFTHSHHRIHALYCILLSYSWYTRSARRSDSSEKVEYKKVEDDRTQCEIGKRSVRARWPCMTAMNKGRTDLSGDTSLNSERFSGLTCALSEAVRTNCPTELANLHSR